MFPVQVAVHNVTLPPAVEADIRRRAAHLARFHQRITGCRVLVDVPQRRRRSDHSQYRVRIDLRTPGRDLVVDRQPRAALGTALDHAFEAMRRRLQDRVRRRQGAVKVHVPTPRAQVAELFPLAGYGFLETADGERIYFDRASVLKDGFDRLSPGAEVRYTEELGERGRQATTVAIARRRAVATPES